MLRLTIAMLTVVALLLAGCAQTAQKAVEGATGVKVDEKKDTVTVQTKEGEMTVGAMLPDGLKDFPVPSGFKLDSGGSISSGGDKVSVGTWKGKSTMQEASAFYKKTAGERGWAEDMAFESGDGGQHHYSSKSGESYIVTFTKKDGGEVEVSVMHSKSAQKPTPTAGTVASQPSPATPTSGRPEPTPTPVPPALADPGALPQEMRELPVPGGFGIVKDSVMRVAAGGKFAMAGASWFGKGEVAKIKDFYEKELKAKGWEENWVSEHEEGAELMYTRDKDGVSFIVTVALETEEAGIRVNVSLMAQ